MTDNEMLQTGLNYELLVEDALRSVVRTSLSIVEKVGLPGETHFYISFSTTHPGVEISDDLRTKHPENMTIVLQHQFGDLIVGIEEFSSLCFSQANPARWSSLFNQSPALMTPRLVSACSLVTQMRMVTTMSAPCLMQGLTLFLIKTLILIINMVTKQGASAVDAPTRLQKRDEKYSAKCTDDGDNGADVVSLDTFRKKPT